ncbi:MAG: hypothetical protein HUU02_07075 [Bacteroidetes bacterium]|nr:hypothetical protein [Bacteroidota bacterium]
MSSSDTIRLPRPQRRFRLETGAYDAIDAAGGRSAVLKADQPHAVPMVPLGMVSEEREREAFERGIEEGSRRTTALLQEQYAVRMEEEARKVAALMDSIQRVLVLQSAETEQALFRFAIGVAEQIIRREVEQDTEILLAIMKDGIRKIVGVERMKVRVNPADLEYVHDRKQTIQSVSDSLREIVFEGDPSVGQGSCAIESDIGNVDARIASQLDQVRDIISKHS